MEDISIWKEKFKITHSLVAPDGFASIHGLAYCMQESAVNHSDALKLGYDDLIRKNIAWVLTRQAIKLYEIPRLNDTITIETWADSYNDTMVVRDFNILDKQKETRGITRTSWMLLDLITRRPVRIPSDILENISLEPGRLTEPLVLEKIPPINEQTDHPLTFHVVFSDLDMNHHVNNINYLKWVLDSFNYDFRMKYRIRSIETNYLGEALYGDQLIRRTVTKSNLEYLTAVINTSTLRPILSSKTKWALKG
jgi:acyl-ACP thioesterase